MEIRKLSIQEVVLIIGLVITSIGWVRSYITLEHKLNDLHDLEERVSQLYLQYDSHRDLPAHSLMEERYQQLMKHTEERTKQRFYAYEGRALERRIEKQEELTKEIQNYLMRRLDWNHEKN